MNLLGQLQRSLEHGFARLHFGHRRRVRLYLQMSSLLNAGLSASEALDLCWEVASCEGSRPGEPDAIVFADIRNGVHNGLGLGKALRKWVPAEDSAAIEAFEDSEDLPGRLEAYCDCLKRKGKMRNAIVEGLLPGVSARSGLRHAGLFRH